MTTLRPRACNKITTPKQGLTQRLLRRPRLSIQSYVQTELADYTTTASLTQNYYTKTATDSAISSATTNLASQTYVQTELADYTTGESSADYYTKTDADSAIATATTNLASQTYVQTELADYTTTANLNLNYYTKTGADSAISSSIGTYTTTVGNETLTLQQHHSSINGIEGKYSIKIDDNGVSLALVLYQLRTTGCHRQALARHLLSRQTDLLSRLMLMRPQQNSNVGDNYPFKVFTTTHNVTDADGNQAYDDNGNAIQVPAGVYIKDAFIHNGQITSAAIEHGTITMPILAV